MDGDVVSVERVIPAPPERIFELISDAGKHPVIDGSGTLVNAKPGAPQRLTLGSTFGMAMKAGIRYSMVNEVIEYEENKRIAWQARPSGAMARIVGGRIWRYELEPADGGTRVRESWDVSRDKQRFLLKRGPIPRHTRESIEKTLEKIEQLVTSDPA